MKQFAQCAHCQQWYTRTATAPIEIYQGDRLHCIAIWCLGCIQDAEQRSAAHTVGPRDVTSSTAYEASGTLALPVTLPQLLAEHLRLMDRALQDEEDVLVPVIQRFIECASLYQGEDESPEQRQRLRGHVHYWETFLKALHAHD
ncbi:MAG: hypothetical protein AB7N91_25715 [Candidatus Tectimicrobiota bacterium]